MGINIDKYFMPSVANVIGTDMSNYKVVANGQFACNLMHVGRDEKIPVALNTEDPIIVSPAYFVFEVCDDSLLPEYLELSLRNPEFDRNAWFHTDGDVRGGMDKEGMKDLLIPVPPLEEQRSIVSRYKAIETRISNNKQTIAKLEESAQALYRKMFVDDVDVENLPEGWRRGCLTDIAEYFNGLACQNFETDSIEYYPVLKIRELGQGHFDNNSNHATKDVPTCYIIKDGDIIFSWSATLLVDFWVGGIGVLNQHLFKVTPIKYPNWFVYFSTQRHIEGWKTFIAAKATSMGHIKREDLENAEIVIPDSKTLEEVDDKISPLVSLWLQVKKENEKLTEMLSMMMA